MESDGLVPAETVKGTISQHSENVLQPEGEADNIAGICSTSAETYRELNKCRRRRGRPRKEPLQLFISKEMKPRTPAELGSIHHQHADFVTSLTKHLGNHTAENVPKTFDPHSVSDSITDDNILQVPRRTKRRRIPTRQHIGDFKPLFTEVNSASVSPADANSLDIARSRISKRDPLPAKKGVIIEPDYKVDHKDMREILLKSKDPLRPEELKKNGPKAHDHLVPANIPKPDDIQRMSLVACNKQDCGEGAESEETVALNPVRKETDGERRDGFVGLESVTKQFPNPKEDATLSAVLHPQPVVQSEGFSSQDLKSHYSQSITSISPKVLDSRDVNSDEEMQSNHTTESRQHHKNDPNVSLTDVQSIEKLAKIIPIPTAVKTENVKLELNLSPSVSESTSHVVFKHPKTTTATPENQLLHPIAYRRKRGGKRRRRPSHILLQTANLKEGQELSAGDLDNSSTKTVQMNVSYIKKGGKTLLKCGDCSQVFKFQSQFIIHQRVHTGERPYQCPECDKAFSKNSNLNLHLKMHRKNDGSQKCQICRRMFPTSEYEDHVKTHTLNRKIKQNSEASFHETTFAPTTTTTLTSKEPEVKVEKVCQYCGKTFRFQSALIRHVRIHTGEKPFKCDICGKAFGQAYFLRVHELTHWSVKRYNCTHCKKSFAHYSNARKHTCRPLQNDTDPQRLQPSLTYTCHICKSISGSLQQFNSHMREHTGTQLYRCLYCDKLFGDHAEFSSHRNQCLGGRTPSSSDIQEEQRVSLVQYRVPRSRSKSVSAHLLGSERKTSSKSKPVQAPKKRPIDSKRPFQSTVMASHPLSHFVSILNNLDDSSDPRRYLCPSCGRLFRHMGRLRAHMLTHRAQCYTCTCCGRTLESWRKLWLHQRVHRQRHGRFTCPQCGQGFRFAEAYKRHMSNHRDFHWVQVRPKRVLLPYQCDQCRGSFETLDQLFSHQLCHISMQEPQGENQFDLSFVNDSKASQSRSRVGVLPENNLDDLTLMANQTDGIKAPSAAVKSQYLLPKMSTQDGFVVQTQGLAVSRNTPSLQEQNNKTSKNCDLSVGTSLGRPITHIKTVKEQTAQNAAEPNVGSLDEVKCVVCGNVYPAIADLYQHYLKHARDEV